MKCQLQLPEKDSQSFLCTYTFPPVGILLWNVLMPLQQIQQFKNFVHGLTEVSVELVWVHLQFLHLTVKLFSAWFPSNLVHRMYPPHPFWSTLIVMDKKASQKSRRQAIQCAATSSQLAKSPPIPYSSWSASWSTKPHFQLILTAEHNVNKGVICSAAWAQIGSDPNWCTQHCPFLCPYTLL